MSAAGTPVDRRDPLRRERRDRPGHLGHAVDVGRGVTEAHQTLLDHDVDERGEQPHVGARADEEMLVGGVGGLGAPRVDDDDPAAPARAGRAAGAACPGRS